MRMGIIPMVDVPEAEAAGAVSKPLKRAGIEYNFLVRCTILYCNKFLDIYSPLVYAIFTCYSSAPLAIWPV